MGPVGVATVSEAFALYAQGWHGIINELYVVPQARSSGVGEAMISTIRHFARRSGWRRIEVTAPESPRWERTRRFYEREGFSFTGPKLKYLVPQDGESDAPPV
jgi:GNAT superfamily N-acetyltransferase